MKRVQLLIGIAALAFVATGCSTQGKPAATDQESTGTQPPAQEQPVDQADATVPTEQPADEPAAQPQEPASWTEYRYRWESNGYGSSVTIPVPEGWTVKEEGDKIDYRDPSGQMLLRLNREQIPPGDPVDVFASVEAEVSGQFPGYVKGGINYSPLGEPPNGVDGTRGATWDFQFTNEDGVERTVIIAGFHPSTEDDDWVTIYFSAPTPVWVELSGPIFWRHATKFVMAG